MRRELAPKPHMIHSVVSNNWTVQAALAEFVDNAFAPNKGGADAIWIEVHHDRILVWDHGRGVDDINRLFQLGNTSSWRDRSDIGLYGVGGTHAAIWLGHRLRVSTVRQGRLHQHEADWDRCVKKECWPAAYRGAGTEATRLPVPKELFNDPEPRGGTLLEIIRRRRGRNFQMDALLERLGFTFSPGLMAGKRIFVRRGDGEWKEARPFSPPQLTEQVDFESSVAGMTYRCRAGLMVPTVLRYNGFFYGFTHRIIEKTRDPFREGDSSLLHAHVQLSADWKSCIADHKQAVVAYRDELAEDLYRHCQKLIERGREFEQELHLEELEIKLESLVNEMISVRQASKPSEPKAGPKAHPAADRDPQSVAGSDEREPNGEVRDRARHASGVRFRFDAIPVIALCVEDGDQLLVKVKRDDPQVMQAMGNPVNSWGLVTHIMAAVTSHLLARYLLDGEAALRRYLPAAAQRIKAGMGPNEIAAEIMTILMRAFPGSSDPSYDPFAEAA